MQQYQIQEDLYRGCHIKVKPDVQVSSFLQFVDGEEKIGNKYRSIWIYINTVDHIQLLSQLTNQMGYSIHHAFDKEMVVYKWISQQQNKTVPFSMFWVAAGAVVIKDDKILLVEEKSGKRKGKYGLPGGRANKQQMVASCAERQLLEQTGIKAKFRRVIFIRQSNQSQIYDCVDIYFICLMRLQENSFQNFKICEHELSNFKWVPLSQYVQFSKSHSMGTQQLVAKHIDKIYKQNSLFVENEYFNDLNHVKGLCQHRL